MAPTTRNFRRATTWWNSASSRCSTLSSGRIRLHIPKPAGDMIHAFAKATELPPEEIAMIGDNPHDIETARAGGAGLAIGVLSGNASPDDIAHLADHTIESIAELPAIAEAARLMFYDPRRERPRLEHSIRSRRSWRRGRSAGFRPCRRAASPILHLIASSTLSPSIRTTSSMVPAAASIRSEYRGDGRVRGQSCDACALREHMNVSSATVAADVDEFELAGLAKAPCRIIKPPRVAASPVCLECILHQVVPLPDDNGDIGDYAVIGRVAGIFIEDRFIEGGPCQYRGDEADRTIGLQRICDGERSLADAAAGLMAICAAI